MTVQQLIEHLRQHPPTAIVVVNHNTEYGTPVYVERVEGLAIRGDPARFLKLTPGLKLTLEPEDDKRVRTLVLIDC